MHIEESLIKLNILLFLAKDDELLEKYNENWENLKRVSKKNLVVNLFTMKNI